jgi:hypothetical protein
VSGGAFVPPSYVKHITTSTTFTPPIAGAYPGGNGNSYNTNAIGGLDAYIQYAPAHNGKLLKPLIFVDGIDFNETVYTWDGEVIRHGSTGWDIFQMGNDPSSPNADDTDPPVFRNYPASLNKLQDNPNDYDIIFADFEHGSDWIQKNGNLLIELHLGWCYCTSW